MKHLDTAIMAATGMACTTTLFIHALTWQGITLAVLTFALVAMVSGAKTRAALTRPTKTPHS